MRCATCGTENAPDSRFCGGCGARVAPQEHRLAPTHKIRDDAPYPPAGAVPTGPRPAVSQGPVSYAPPSMPPAPAPARAAATPAPAPAPAPRASSPPGSAFGPTGGTPAVSRNNRAVSQPPTHQPKPSVSSGSSEFAAPPRRPLGLIAIVLIIDLGLAAAGGVLLAKGLASKEKAAEKKSEATTPASSQPAPAPPPAVKPEPAPPTSAPVKSEAPAKSDPKNAARKETNPTREKPKPSDKAPVTKPSEKKPSEKAAPVTKPSEVEGKVESVPTIVPTPQDPPPEPPQQ